MDGAGWAGACDGGAQPANAFIILKVCAGKLEKMSLEKEVRPDTQKSSILTEDTGLWPLGNGESLKNFELGNDVIKIVPYKRLIWQDWWKEQE